jgi:hypothetical protein
MRARIAFALAWCVVLATPRAGAAASMTLESAWGAQLPAPPEAFAAGVQATTVAATLPLSAWPLEPPVLATKVSGNSTERPQHGALNAERARVMLQSLTVPGWGQVTTGHPGAAKTFMLIETSIWVSFAAFEMQESMRMQSSVRTAQLFAGIDLHGRSDEYRRIVGSYPSSDEYNRLVVYRDAANLYFNDPAAYRAYIAAHEITGSNAWSWVDPDSYARYSSQRKSSQKAGLRANTALALALANRLVSAIHAASASGHTAPKGNSLRLELVPDFAQVPPAMRLDLRATY